jgi:thymidylate synthase
MKKQNIEPQNFANTGQKFLKKLDKLIDILTKSVETNNENELQRDLQLEIFDFEKILNDEVLMYNQASLNIYGYCLEKFKDSGVEFNEKNKIDNIINEINKNLNE